MRSAPRSHLQRETVTPEQEPSLRLYRRLWISADDLREAKATISEILESGLRRPHSERPSPLLMALTTALVVSYARPFVNSRGGSEIADRTVPGSLLRTLTSKQRKLHDSVVEMRNREVAHSDADVLELMLELFPEGDGAISRVTRDPLLKADLRALDRIIDKLTDAIELRCEYLRSKLPHNVWL